MAPDVACAPVFFGAPLIGAASMLLAMTLVPIAGVYAPGPIGGDLLVLIYLLAGAGRGVDARRLVVRLSLWRDRLLARDGDDARLRGPDRAHRRRGGRCASAWRRGRGRRSR